MAEYVGGGPPAERPVLLIDRPVLTPSQEQEKWLAEALMAVSHKAAVMRGYMQAAINEYSYSSSKPPSSPSSATGDASVAAAARTATTGTSGGFMAVVRAAASLLDELRNGVLAPHNYYELYMRAFDEMAGFQRYIEEEHSVRRRSIEDMYEAVQYSGHIVPRLYLLITVGAVYMASGEGPALPIFQDLVEMCKGVQHPTRGLFLRTFLLNMTKRRLPGDIGRRTQDDPAADHGSALDSARLLVQNAREMNWLWIRMEAKWYGNDVQMVLGGKDATSPSMTSRRTQADRRELRVLVGMNVVRISQLDGISLHMYREVILPQLMTVIMNYREPVAQQYLLEVVVQVFPDEFHLFTLDTLLTTVSHLTVAVDVNEILGSLMDRLGNHVVALREDRAGPATAEEQAVLDRLFDIFMGRLAAVEISYASKAPELREIKRSSAAAPVTPIPLATFVAVMAGLARMATKIAVEGDQGNNGNSNGSAAGDDDISAVLQCVADKFAAAPPLSAVLQQEHEARSPPPHHGGSSRNQSSSNVSDLPPFAVMPEGAESMPAITAAALAAAERLVAAVVAEASGLDSILSMDGLAALVAQLPFRGRRAAALAVCEAALSPNSSNSAAAAATTASPPPIRSSAALATLDGVTRLFELMDPLLCDQADAPADPSILYAYDPAAEFAEEQQAVCRLLHLIDCPTDPGVYLRMLSGVRKLLGQGGARRAPVTLPALAALYLRAVLRLYLAGKDAGLAVEEERLAARLCGPAVAGPSPATIRAPEEDGEGGAGGAKKRQQQLEKQLAKAFRHLHSGDGKGVLEVLAAMTAATPITAAGDGNGGSASSPSSSSSLPPVAFYAYLAAAKAADTCELPQECYQLYGEALALYEGHQANTRQQGQGQHSNSSSSQHHQYDALVCLINSLCTVANLPPDSYGAIAAKVCRYCSKLLRRSDQSRLIAQCANMFAKKGKRQSAPIVGAAATKQQQQKKREEDGADDDGEEGGADVSQPKDASGGGDDAGTDQQQQGSEYDAEQRATVLECLGRSSTTAQRITHPLLSLAVHVDLLNIFLHFFASKVVRLEAGHVNGLVERINSLSESHREGGDADNSSSNNINGVASDHDVGLGEEGEGRGKSPAVDDEDTAAAAGLTFESIRQVYRNTTKYIRSRQTVDPRWEEIEV